MVHFSGDRGEDHRALLEDAFGAMGRPVPASVGGLAAYLDELALWASRFGITGFRTAAERVHGGVMDCVPLADALARGARVVDVGSGNGLPGMVIALLVEEVRVTLVEPRARSAAFLRTAAVRCGARNVTVSRCRVEDLDPGSGFDAAVSRAVFEPSRWLAVGAGLVRRGGSVFLMLGEGPEPEPPDALTLADRVGYGPVGGIVTRFIVRYDRS